MGLTVRRRASALDAAAAGLEDLAHLAQLVRVSRDEDWCVSYVKLSQLARLYSLPTEGLRHSCWVVLLLLLLWRKVEKVVPESTR